MHFRTQHFRSEYIDNQRGGNSEAQVIFLKFLVYGYVLGAGGHLYFIGITYSEGIRDRIPCLHLSKRSTEV